MAAALYPLICALAGASRPALRVHTPVAASSRAMPVVTMMAYSVESPIGVGGRLPEVTVEVGGNLEAAASLGATKSINQVLGSGKSILLGMPGAFTPTCNDIHLPGYYKNAAEFKDLGIDTIALVTTNDRFVNAQWQKSMEECMGVPEGKSPVVMVSDARGDLAESLGLIGYLGRALGVRSKRFALVVEDGVVTYKAVDQGSDELAETSAENVMQWLDNNQSLLPGLPPTWQFGLAGALLFFLWFADNF